MKPVDMRLSPALFGRNPKWALVRIGLWMFCAFLLFHFVIMPVRVTGRSMAPTYLDGEFHLAYRLAYLNSPPKRGDVVVIKTRLDRILKRIVALPGEHVSMSDGVLFINGRPLAEKYAKGGSDWVLEPRTLGKDEYVVIGDNRTMDQGRHTHGLISLNQIEGRIVF